MIKSRTPVVQPLTFGNEYVILPITHYFRMIANLISYQLLKDMRLLIITGINIIPC